MKGFGYLIALGGVVAALLVPAQALARVGGSGNESVANLYTPSALAAWGQRMQAQVDYYRSGLNERPAASYYTPEALNAWGQRMQAEATYYLSKSGGTVPDDRSGVRGSGPTPVPVTSDDGTNWGTIGLGVGSGVFAVLLAAGFAVAVRRSRHVAHA